MNYYLLIYDYIVLQRNIIPHSRIYARSYRGERFMAAAFSFETENLINFRNEYLHYTAVFVTIWLFVHYASIIVYVFLRGSKDEKRGAEIKKWEFNAVAENLILSQWHFQENFQRTNKQTNKPFQPNFMFIK